MSYEKFGHIAARFVEADKKRNDGWAEVERALLEARSMLETQRTDLVDGPVGDRLLYHLQCALEAARMFDTGTVRVMPMIYSRTHVAPEVERALAIVLRQVLCDLGEIRGKVSYEKVEERCSLCKDVLRSGHLLICAGSPPVKP